MKVNNNKKVEIDGFQKVTTGLTAWAKSASELSENSENHPRLLHKNSRDNVSYP